MEDSRTTADAPVLSVQELRTRAGLPAFPFAASYHGEFELVFTLDREKRDAFLLEAGRIGWHPLQLGHVERGEGLATVAGDIDGAWVRNLLQECGGDFAEYARNLIARSPGE